MPPSSSRTVESSQKARKRSQLLATLLKLTNVVADPTYAENDQWHMILKDEGPAIVSTLMRIENKLLTIDTKAGVHPPHNDSSATRRKKAIASISCSTSKQTTSWQSKRRSERVRVREQKRIKQGNPLNLKKDRATDIEVQCPRTRLSLSNQTVHSSPSSNKRKRGVNENKSAYSITPNLINLIHSFHLPCFLKKDTIPTDKNARHTLSSIDSSTAKVVANGMPPEQYPFCAPEEGTPEVLTQVPTGHGAGLLESSHDISSADTSEEIFATRPTYEKVRTEPFLSDKRQFVVFDDQGFYYQNAVAGPSSSSRIPPNSLPHVKLEYDYTLEWNYRSIPTPEISDLASSYPQLYMAHGIPTDSTHIDFEPMPLVHPSFFILPDTHYHVR